MTRPNGKPDRALLVVLAVIGALVAIALIVVLTRGTPAPLDPSTPEGVVQRYSAAVIDGDEEAAKEYLEPDVRSDCEHVDSGLTGDTRVTLVSSRIRTETAQVTVSIVNDYSGGGPFGASQYEFEDTFDLVRDDGGWLIRTAPWPLTVCMDAGGMR